MSPALLDAEAGGVDADVATPAIRAVNLTLSFGAKTVLDEVSLDFPARAITSLLGPTGSGKTTFLRSLNRMNDKVSGYRHSGDVLLGARRQQQLDCLPGLFLFHQEVGESRG